MGLLRRSGVRGKSESTVRAMTTERDIAVFGGYPVDLTGVEVPEMPVINYTGKHCPCGAWFTPGGSCSAGYTKHAAALAKLHAA